MEGRFRLHILPVFGNAKLGQITSGDVDVFLNSKRDAGLSQQTRKHLRNGLSAVFAFASNQCPQLHKGDNPVLKARKIVVPKKEVNFLEPAEAAKLVSAVPERWRAMFATAIYTGLRRGELLALRRDDVDFVRSVLRVARSNDSETTKSGKTRYVGIPDELVLYLKRQLAAHPHAFVFPSTNGGLQRGDKANLGRCLRNAMKRCGLERKLRFHDLRCTYGTLAYEQTSDIRCVQNMLGHADVKTTERYVSSRMTRYVQMCRKLSIHG